MQQIDEPAGEEARLSTLLQADAVSLEVLHDRYGPVLELVRVLIGVVPNCDRYLEIWPPAFRTYNIMVPNFLNLPFGILGFGGAPASVVGLGLYVSSRAAECPYCSAHTCSFALRRGASPEKMAEALVGRDASFTGEEIATIAVARSLARIPCELIDSEREALERELTAANAEWIVAGIVMMGFLNKAMDALGVELERSTAAETSKAMGPTWSAGKAGVDLKGLEASDAPPQDTLWTKLRIIPYLPTALYLDGEWQRGVPNSWPDVGDFLREKTGHDFPVLSRLQHKRIIRGVASMLRENLDPKTTIVGLPIKILVAVIFATVVSDKALAVEARAMAAKFGVSENELNDAARFAEDLRAEPPTADARGQAVLIVARAASPSPAQIDDAVLDACRRGGLSAAGIVEVVTWIAVLQMLHRLTCYYAAVSPGD